MTAYYNEFDPFAAAWLRELIKAGHIAQGDVDERSIEDICPQDLKDYTQCHFFAGIGVWSYALRRAGWPDSRPVWTGSCPCQPFSAAGKRKGTSDERHLWPAFFHLIQSCNPDVVFGEQVASKDGLAWFDTVSTDLEAAGYSVGAADLCAAGFGAPHIRQRLYFVANSKSKQVGVSRCTRESRTACSVENPRHESERRSTVEISPCISANRSGSCAASKRSSGSYWSACDWPPCVDGKSRPVEPGTFPLAHGVANRVGLLRGYGNSLVAPVAQGFIEAFLETEKP